MKSDTGSTPSETNRADGTGACTANSEEKISKSALPHCCTI